MKAILVHQCGGPDQLKLEDVPVPVPGPGQALVKIDTSGVNFIDIYFRIGLYKADLPLIPGMEAAGVVESVGAESTRLLPETVSPTPCLEAPMLNTRSFPPLR